MRSIAIPEPSLPSRARPGSSRSGADFASGRRARSDAGRLACPHYFVIFRDRVLLTVNCGQALWTGAPLLRSKNAALQIPLQRCGSLWEGTQRGRRTLRLPTDLGSPFRGEGVSLDGDISSSVMTLLVASPPFASTTASMMSSSSEV